MLLDLTLGYPFGLHILTKSFAGYIAGNLTKTFYRDQYRIPLLVALGAVSGQELFVFAYFHSVFGSTFLVNEHVLIEIALFLVYSLCFAAGIYRLHSMVVSWLERTAYERAGRIKSR